VPAAQATQEVAPAGAAVPATQLEQLFDPEAEAYWP